MRIYPNRSTSPIFGTTLYVYDNRAEIYDLRSVIEDYMEVHGMPFADCSIGLQVDRTDYYFLSLLPKGISSKLLSATIQCGARSFSLFITDEFPTLRLYDTNEYNYSDVFHLTAQTKRKLAFSRSTAICCGRSSSYDDQTEVEFESETSALTPAVARLLTTALQSFSLLIMSPDYPHGTQVLVTDIESELSDAFNELCHVKFTWRPIRQQTSLPTRIAKHIFDITYNPTFD